MLAKKIASRDLSDFFLSALLPLLGILVIFLPQFLNRQNLYLGVIQEQYFLLGQFSFDHLIRKEFAQGYFPLWNPNNALGSVLLGNMLSAVFYPLKFFLYFSPALFSYQVYIIFRFWLAGFCSYWLARKLGFSKASSGLVLFGFTFSGYFQFFLNENYLNADCLLPLLILLGLYITQNQSKWPLPALAFCLFALFNSGHPEAIFYNWLFLFLSFIGFLFPLERAQRFQASAKFVGANLLAIFLSLPLLLTFLEFWVRGEHFHLPGTGLYHYSMREFLALFSPWFFGPSRPGAPFFHKPELTTPLSNLLFDYQKTSLPWLCPSLGLVFLPLLTITFFELKKLRLLYLLWLGWFLLFLGLSFGLPGFQLLGLVSPFSLSGNFKHPFPGLILSAVVLSAWSLEKIVQNKLSSRKILFGFLASFLLLLLFFPYSNFKSALNFELLLEVGAVFLFFLWLIGSSLFGARMLRLVLSSILAILVFLLSAQVRISWQLPVYLDYHLLELRQNPVFQVLKQDSLARFYFEREIFPPNLNQLLEVVDLRIMDGVNHRQLVSLINQINAHTRKQGFRYWYNQVGYLEVMPEKIEEPLLDLLDLKYVITRSPLPYHRSIEKILQTSEKLTVSPAHLGLAYFPLGKASAKTLFQHPPSLLKFHRCALYEKLPAFCHQGEKDFPPVFVPALRLSFAPRIQPEAKKHQPDGVWFLILSSAQLNYARYIHPREHPEESESPLTDLSLPEAESISLATLPSDHPDFDWAGWLDLRVDVPRESEKLELLSDKGFWFYQNPEAFPRFFLASAGELETNDKNQPQLLFLKGTPNREELLLGPEQTELRLKKFKTQNYELEFEAPENCWLVFSQILFPGWKAVLDDSEQRLWALNFLTGIKVPAGKHQLKIYYQPWSFRVGIYFALTTLVTMLLLGYFIYRQSAKT